MCFQLKTFESCCITQIIETIPSAQLVTDPPRANCTPLQNPSLCLFCVIPSEEIRGFESFRHGSNSMIFKKSISHCIYNKAVCRTAPAKPGLVNNIHIYRLILN